MEFCHVNKYCKYQSFNEGFGFQYVHLTSHYQGAASFGNSLAHKIPATEVI